MEYTVGMVLEWYRDNNYTPMEIVEVSELRSRGQAKLSNGWIVDENGQSEGNARVQGGYVLIPK